MQKQNKVAFGKLIGFENVCCSVLIVGPWIDIVHPYYILRRTFLFTFLYLQYVNTHLHKHFCLYQALMQFLLLLSCCCIHVINTIACCCVTYCILHSQDENIVATSTSISLLFISNL